MLTKEEREDALELLETVTEELEFLKSAQPRIKELYESKELEGIVILYWEYFDARSRAGGFGSIDSSVLRKTFKRNEYEVICHPAQDEVRNLWDYENEFSHLISKYEELLNQIKHYLSR